MESSRSPVEQPVAAPSSPDDAMLSTSKAGLVPSPVSPVVLRFMRRDMKMICVAESEFNTMFGLSVLANICLALAGVLAGMWFAAYVVVQTVPLDLGKAGEFGTYVLVARAGTFLFATGFVIAWGIDFFMKLALRRASVEGTWTPPASATTPPAA